MIKNIVYNIIKYNNILDNKKLLKWNDLDLTKYKKGDKITYLAGTKIKNFIFKGLCTECNIREITIDKNKCIDCISSKGNAVPESIEYINKINLNRRKIYEI